MSGFTLVEVVVALGIMSLVMLALGAAMRTMAQSEVRVDERLRRADEMRVATGFLGSVLGRVSSRRAPGTPPAGASPFQFAGEPDALTWVGVMPPRHGAGGRYFFRLAAEGAGAERALVVRFAPWTPGGGFPDWAQADSRVLVPALTAARFDYAEPEGGGSWTPQWRDIERLPTRVRLQLQAATGDWPELVFALRSPPSGSRTGGTFSVGPE